MEWLPHVPTPGIQTHVSRVAPTKDLCKDALLTELPLCSCWTRKLKICSILSNSSSWRRRVSWTSWTSIRSTGPITPSTTWTFPATTQSSSSRRRRRVPRSRPAPPSSSSQTSRWAKGSSRSIKSDKKWSIKCKWILQVTNDFVSLAVTHVKTQLLTSSLSAASALSSLGALVRVDLFSE